MTIPTPPSMAARPPRGCSGSGPRPPAAAQARAPAAGLLRLARPPTGLVALNDMHAVGACAAVRDAGGVVPDDVSVVGIDDIPLAGLIHPALTTVHQPIEKLGEAAVELVTRRL